MAESELSQQLQFFIDMQKHAPYSDAMTLPEGKADELIAHIKSLGKVTIERDNLGTILSLNGTASLEMRYYRNNILHAYVIPALVCRILERNAKSSHQSVIDQVSQLFALIKAELFLWQTEEEVVAQTEKVLAILAEQEMIKQSKAGFWSVHDCTTVKAKLRVMGECIDETLQRFAIIANLLTQLAPASKSALEEQVITIAKRLSKLNNINAPEFVDKKAQSALINVLKEQGYATTNDNSYLIDTPALGPLKELIQQLSGYRSTAKYCQII